MTLRRERSEVCQPQAGISLRFSQTHSLSRMHFHPNSILRPQSYQRIRHHPMSRYRLKPKPLGHSSNHHPQFQQREPLPNAPPRPIPKRKISSRRQTVLQPIHPPFRPKLLRRIKISRIAMHHPLRHNKCRIRWKIVSANRARRDRSARQNVRRRIKPQHLAHHRAQIRQSLQVRNFRCARAQPALQFFMQTRLRRGIFAQHVPSPGKR